MRDIARTADARFSANSALDQDAAGAHAVAITKAQAATKQPTPCLGPPKLVGTLLIAG